MGPKDYKNKDQELYEDWKRTKDPKKLGALLKQLTPLINKEVNRASGSLPKAALSAEAKKWALEAIMKYDPKFGAALSTHVTSYLRKVRRMNYTYQNSVRLPENLQLKFHEYNSAFEELTDTLNREPDDKEMASQLGWKKAHVTKFKNSLYADNYESGAEKASEFTGFNNDKIRFNYIMENLTPQEKIILEHAKGTSAPDLAKKLNVNVNRLNYLKKKLRTKIQGLQQDIGDY